MSAPPDADAPSTDGATVWGVVSTRVRIADVPQTYVSETPARGGHRGDQRGPAVLGGSRLRAGPGRFRPGRRAAGDRVPGPHRGDRGRAGRRPGGCGHGVGEPEQAAG